MKQLLTVEQVAEILQMSPESVRRFLREGQIKGMKLQKIWRVREEEVERFIDKNSEQGRKDQEGE